MRGLALTVAILCSTAIAAAQQRHPTPSPAAAHPASPSRPTGPPVIMPFPPLMPQPAGGMTSGFVYPPRDHPAYAPGRGSRYPTRGYFGGYAAGAYAPGSYAAGYFSAPDLQPVPESPIAAPEPTGTLQLSGTPSDAQVFVDGFYIATLADLEARGLALPAGPHHVELRASDYTATAFDVRIDPNDTINYRASLEYSRPQPPPVRAGAPAGPTKMYLIPNCYLGNVPPRADQLPQGCDVALVQIIS